MKGLLQRYIVDPVTKQVLLKSRSELQAPPGTLLVEQEEDIEASEGVYDHRLGKVLAKTDDFKSRERSFANLHRKEAEAEALAKVSELKHLISEIPQAQTQAALTKICELLKLI